MNAVRNRYWCNILEPKMRLRPATLCKKETLTQVFFREFCEISKNIFSYRTPPVTASQNENT